MRSIFPFFLVLNIVQSHDQENIHTIQYSADTFSAEISKKNHFVMFYAPWDGYSPLVLKLEQLAEILNKEDGNLRIAKVDCTTNNKICSEQDVFGYPIFKFFQSGRSKSVRFNGEPDLPSLTLFIKEQLKSADEEEKVNNAIPEPTLKSLEITKDAKRRTYEDLKFYFDKMLDFTSTEVNKKNPKTVNSNVVMFLTGNDFRRGVEEGIAVIGFFAPRCGHCKRLAPTWEELAMKFVSSSKVKVVMVDCTLEINKQLCNEQAVNGFPTIFLYKNGKKISEYTGNRSLDDLHNFVIKHLNNHNEL